MWCDSTMKYETTHLTKLEACLACHWAAHFLNPKTHNPHMRIAIYLFIYLSIYIYVLLFVCVYVCT